MGTSGQATEHTVQQILDKPIADEPDYGDYFNLILQELKKINIQLSLITGDEI